MSTVEIFTEIYESNKWYSPESRSGNGSELKNTLTLRSELPFLFKKYNISSILDIPCGDFNWMKEVDISNINYIGADIVSEIVEQNKSKYPYNFQVLDLTKDILPKVDLVFVRDCLGHLSNENVFKALNNIQASNSKYLISTSFTKWDFNIDIDNGGWRCINLMIPPFNLKPIYLINENCIEGYPHYNDKCMIMFDLNNLISL
jgi:hypothetical protein